MSAKGSLLLANRGNYGVLLGQSNANRCGNKTSSAAAAGFSKPASATYWDIQTSAGAALASYSAPFHGPETGLLDELCTVNGKTITLVKRGMDGTALSAWNSTHCATLISDCATAGIVPRWGILIQGENEASSSAITSAAWDTTLIDVLAKFRAVWGASFGLLIIELVGTDVATFPHRSVLVPRQQYAGANFANVEILSMGAMTMDADLTHFTSLTATAVGRAAAQRLLARGLVS
jgi:hypothetical protein